MPIGFVTKTIRKSTDMQLNQKSDPSDALLLAPLAEEITYGATLDIRNVEHEITELMVRRACDQMDEEQQFPFCSKDQDKAVVSRMRRAG